MVDASAAAVVLTTWLDAREVAFVSETHGPDAGPRPVPEAPPLGAAAARRRCARGPADLRAPRRLGRRRRAAVHVGKTSRTAPSVADRSRSAVAVAILVVLVGGSLWVDSEANPSGPMGAQVVVTVEPGAGADGVASSSRPGA